MPFPTLRLAIGALLLTSLNAQPPAIFHDSVVNADGLVATSLPFGAVAPGTRMTLSGVRLENATVTIGGRPAQVLRLSERSMTFLLPLDIPLGPANLIVNAAGGASKPYPLRIDRSAFGIASIRRAGRLLVLEGSGLGSPSDLMIVIAGQPFSPSRVVALTGGKDRIELRLPRDLPRGCHLPVYVRTSAHVSNFVDLAGLPGCADEPWPILGPAAGGAGSLLLIRSTLNADGRTFTADSAQGIFLPGGKEPPKVPIWFPLGNGQCRVESAINSSLRSDPLKSQDPLRMLRLETPGLKTVVVGPSIAVGTRDIPVTGNHLYLSTLGGNSPVMQRPRPLFFRVGTAYEIGVPGSQAGRFSVEMPFADDIAFNAVPAQPIDRSQPFRVTWRTSQPQVAILMHSQNENASVEALCVAKGSDGAFDLPMDVIRSLPATVRAAGTLTGYIGVAAIGPPLEFPVKGVRRSIASVLRLRLEQADFR